MDPYAIGEARQAAAGLPERSRRGMWFTPQEVAEPLVAHALARWRRPAPPASVLDPAVGGGAFLLAAHDRLPVARLRGVDADPVSAQAAIDALAAVGAQDVDILVGDGLAPDREPADLVLGNPPFLSQLSATTARDARRRAEVRAWYGDSAAGYVDEAGLFLLATARHLLAPGGVAVLIVPEALLATAAAAPLRAAVAARCDVEVVWRDTARAFTTVPTCAIALTCRRGAAASHRRGARWAGMLADGIPDIAVGTSRTIGDVATATADFRDAYYLVADHAGDHPGGELPDDAVRIVPVGLIDPAHLRWGRAPVRFAKRRLDRPIARALPEAFLAARRGVKVLLATQTRVLEALVDDDGDLLPTTPVISLRTEVPWHVGAALTSPVLSAIAARRHAGAGLGRGAVKLSARQVLELPLPAAGSAAWDDAAEAFREAHAATGPAARRQLLERCGHAMWTAFDLPADEEATTWWAGRLPTR